MRSSSSLPINPISETGGKRNAQEISPHVPAGVTMPDHLAAYGEGRSLDDVLRETQALYEASAD